MFLRFYKYSRSKCNLFFTCIIVTRSYPHTRVTPIPELPPYPFIGLNTSLLTKVPSLLLLM